MEVGHKGAEENEGAMTKIRTAYSYRIAQTHFNIHTRRSEFIFIHDHDSIKRNITNKAH